MKKLVMFIVLHLVLSITTRSCATTSKVKNLTQFYVLVSDNGYRYYKAHYLFVLHAEAV